MGIMLIITTLLKSWPKQQNELGPESKRNNRFFAGEKLKEIVNTFFLFRI